jgi:signal transduction histidine kinase
VSNVIQFPLAASDDPAARAGSHHHVGAAFLAEPAQPSHFVQFYEEEEFLFDTVGQFLAAGLGAGDRVVVIATPAHRAGFLRRLEALDVEGAIASGQLTLLDVRETLAKFMVGDMPDPDLFRDMLARLMAKMKGEGGEHRYRRVRAYGEMVDLLWRQGSSNAAIRLEELWSEAGETHSFALLCAYVMGNFYKEGDQARFMEVCRNHSHVIPTERFARLDDLHARLREISLLQQRAQALEHEINHRKELESALREALKQRSRVEEELRLYVVREREARAQAEASDAFKEEFIGVLGHDLRNPLATILATARLMARRGELSAESDKRLRRMVLSGERMQRMIEQILDMTRVRHGTGIVVTRREQDLHPLVSRIVDETRAAHPGRTIDLRAQACTAFVDGDRLEQVVSNLLANAVKHGDPDEPIEVAVVARDGVVSLSVHNHGAPIDPAFMPLLFNPFQRERPQRHSDGLGLGLYISERIVDAHGGKIEVESTEKTGTRFEVILPQRP